MFENAEKLLARKSPRAPSGANPTKKPDNCRNSNFVAAPETTIRNLFPTLIPISVDQATKRSGDRPGSPRSVFHAYSGSQKVSVHPVLLHCCPVTLRLKSVFRNFPTKLNW